MHLIYVKQLWEAVSSTNYIADLAPSLIRCVLNIPHMLMNPEVMLNVILYFAL